MYDRSRTNRLAARPPLVTTLIFAAAVLLPALVFLILTLHDRSHRREASHQDALMASLRAAEQTIVAVQGALLAVERVDDATGGLNWGQIQGRRSALQGEIRRFEQGVPHLAGFVVMRPDGRVALATGVEVAANADLSTLDTVRRLRETPRVPLFDLAPREAFGLSPILLVGRSRGAEGRPPDGAIFAELKVESLLAAWQGFGSEGGRFALIRDDGVALVRSDAMDGRGFAPDDPIRPAIAAGRTAPMLADPFATGAPQVVAWQRVGTYPLVVVYATPPPGVGRWLQDNLLNIGISISLGLAFILFAMRVRTTDRTDAATLERLEANAAELRAEITRREAAEEGLRNAQRLEGLGRLTGGVAHDFNNLLTAILGTARSLERHLGPSADERTKRLIAATVAAVDRGARLNASLLAFARRQPLTLATVDANALVQNFLPLLRRALDETMSVDLSLDPSLPTCNADAAQLEAALLNLTINARDAMPKGGSLRITTRRAWLQEQALAGNADAQPGPYVAIEIRDSGQGMSAEVRERAFEPFFTTKAPGQGTGLGLSQVFGFIRQIGGHVSIQSAAGRGTAVTLYLPLGSAMDQPTGGTAAAAKPDPHSGVGCTVMVVEDEPAVRAVAVDMLQDAGFAVLAAPDGPSALALLREGAHVDILFSDVVMPGGMTGVDLAREARRLRPSLGVLLASGYAAEALAQHGGAGDFELIGKPYDSDTVLTRLAAQRQRQAEKA
ncbi:response regulator [Roseomonas sp. JC162]|uniref:histidine kinase n=1 Tax=Neoroseomonas marina TaxID=1232220 RepID=A0A848EA22_9PROT|nr:response regulator [Neoroseomonas marina]